MKKFMFLLVATTVWMVTACSKDDAVLTDNENLITELKLYIEGSDTRATNEYVPGVGFKFKWENTEPVYVYPAEIGNSSYTIFKYNEGTGTFTLDEGSPLVEGKKYYAVNGIIDSGFNSGKICAAMELRGNGLLGSIPMVSDIFTATAEGTFTTLHHMMGIVEIPVKGSIEIYSIYMDISGSTDELLCGTFTVEFDGDGKVSTITKTGSSETSMQPTVKYYSSSRLVLSETDQSLFFPALPGTYDKVKITYSKKDAGGGWETENLSNSLTVQRGKINKKSTAVTITE